MTKLPKLIRVAAFDVSIEPLSDLKQFSENRYGDFNEVTGHIRVQSSSVSDPARQLDTLLHEINHAIWWAYSLEDLDKEERVVSVMATGLVQVLRDNPKLLKYINEVLNET